MDDTHSFDIAVIGAGIVGASIAARLLAAPTNGAPRRVALIEAEEAAGYHSTGRSAALWILNYGPPDVRVLTGLSRQFFLAPPTGFSEAPLHAPRAIVFLAPPEQEAHLRGMLAAGSGLREIPLAELATIVPALRPDYAVLAGIEDDAFDIDVAALHQGFLRQVRTGGGILALRSRAGRIERKAGAWHIEVSGGATFAAPIVVNAGGAWGDEIARIAGVGPLGLVPKRRTGVIVDAAPWHPHNWPSVQDAAHTWYCRAEARTKLMVSPADETDTDPHDVQPDELDVAIAIDRMQQALDIEVRRVERAWAGLRTFTPDRSLAIGWDHSAPGFFWSVGQGGYGIQTSPAASLLAAALIDGHDPGEAAQILHSIDPRRFPPLSSP